MGADDGALAGDGYPCPVCDEPITNIVEVMEHTACEGPTLSADALSDDEVSTLLYIESQMVDGHHVEDGVRLDVVELNHDDFSNIELFQAAGIMQIEDREYSLLDLKPHYGHGIHATVHPTVTAWTKQAWYLAHSCRRKRGESRFEGSEHVDMEVEA